MFALTAGRPHSYRAHVQGLVGLVPISGGHLLAVVSFRVCGICAKGMPSKYSGWHPKMP